jgi:hypothetical protein
VNIITEGGKRKRKKQKKNKDRGKRESKVANVTEMKINC